MFNNIFGSSQPAAQPAATPAAPAQPAPTGLEAAVPNTVPATTPGTAPNGIVPEGGAAAPVTDPSIAASPLDEFSTLWDTDPNAKATPEVTPTLDSTKLQEVVSRIDFSSAVTPENLAAIQAGGEGAVAATTEAMGAIAQQALMHSIKVSNKLIEQAIAKNSEKMEASIPEMLRAQNLSSNLTDTNPIFNNPAIKPIIEATQAQLLIKHPQATTKQLTEMAQKYVLASFKALNPEKPVDTTGADAPTDWSTFLEEGL
jgi:hypothetical protein